MSGCKQRVGLGRASLALLALACCTVLSAASVASAVEAPSANRPVASGAIDSGLAKRLEAMSPGDKVGVIVTLRAKANLAAVSGRPQEVLTALKTAAARGQASFVPFLEHGYAVDSGDHYI